jgi:hypothetical protein
MPVATMTNPVLACASSAAAMVAWVPLWTPSRAVRSNVSVMDMVIVSPDGGAGWVAVPAADAGALLSFKNSKVESYRSKD